MTNEPKRGAIAGAGYFADFQAEAWNRMEGVKIVGVADRKPDKARAFADRHRIPAAYDSVAELLERERPDFLDIVTRPDTHAELAAMAAERGVDVICQKPLATSLDQAAEMIERCAARGVRLLVHENWRWQPWYREARRVLEAGTLGRVLQASFFWRTGDGRGVEPYQTQPYFRNMPQLLVFESLSHILDTFRFLLGPVESVHCRLNRVNTVIAGEDQALITLQFGCGALGLIDANRITGPLPSPVAMGSMHLEGEAGALKILPAGEMKRVEIDGSEWSVPLQIPSLGYKGDSVFATQRHLLQCMVSEQLAESEGRTYLETMALVEGCYASARTGRSIRMG